MISFIRGKLVKKTPTHIEVETNGVGFKLWIPLSSFEALGDVGEDVFVLSYLHAREDVLRLYGFATEEERSLFLLLISVAGIGPRLAQGILSGIPVADFKTAVENQDITALTSAPGIGKKTAERLILELKEKITESMPDRGVVPSPAASTCEEEAVLALVSLGFKQGIAKERVQKVLREDPALTVEETIRRSLRQI